MELSQDTMDKLGGQHLRSSSDPSEQRLLLGKSATYLAMIAVVLQLSPLRMLTVSQVGETRSGIRFQDTDSVKPQTLMFSVLLVPR